MKLSILSPALASLARSAAHSIAVNAGWGTFSAIAGFLVSHFGAHVLFEASLIGGILGLLPTAMLPTYALKDGGFRHAQRTESNCTSIADPATAQGTSSTKR